MRESITPTLEEGVPCRCGHERIAHEWANYKEIISPAGEMRTTPIQWTRDRCSVCRCRMYKDRWWGQP